MSKRSRTLKNARARLSAQQATPVTKIKTPADVLAIIPYLLGFSPEESVVILSLEGPRQRVGPCMRADLLGPETALQEVDYLMSVVTQHRFTSVLLVAYTADEPRAAAVVQPLRARLRAAGVTVSEALRADGQRWWSYECNDPYCCSSEGTGYDVQSSRAAADAVVAGMSKAPDRESLRHLFDPLDPQYRAEVAAGCVAHGGGGSDGCEGIELLVRLAITGDDPAAMTPADAAAMLLAVQSDVVRDCALSLFDREDADEQFELWRHLMRAAPEDLMPAAGALAGFAAWLCGRGAVAAFAVERVLQVSPRYPMAMLLNSLLVAAVNPVLWAEMRDTEEEDLQDFADEEDELTDEEEEWLEVTAAEQGWGPAGS